MSPGRRRRWAWLAALLFAACGAPAPLAENDDPTRYELSEDVVWASPAGFDLRMDIYTPKSGGPRRPVLVMFHGGGWLINDKSIMDQAAAYLATRSRYTICNVDYRLLSDQGNTITLNQIVDDALGAVLWVKENIERYGGDPARVAVTGDSAGGHLAAMVVNAGRRLSSAPFSVSSPTFHPTYLPPGRTPEQVAEAKSLVVQAAILSYGAFDLLEGARGGFEGWTNPFWFASGSLPRRVFGPAYNVDEHPELYRAVSPQHTIPPLAEAPLPPQLLTVGSEDPVVTPDSVRTYLEALRAAGHPAEYWEYDGRSHAFLDSGSNLLLGTRFETDAPEALDVMIRFLDGVL